MAMHLRCAMAPKLPLPSPPSSSRTPTSLLVFLCRHCHLAKASHCKLATKWLRQMGYVIKCGYSNCMYASLHVVSQYTRTYTDTYTHTCVFSARVCMVCMVCVCVRVYLALPGTVGQNERSQPSVAALCMLCAWLLFIFVLPTACCYCRSCCCCCCYPFWAALVVFAIVHLCAISLFALLSLVRPR